MSNLSQLFHTNFKIDKIGRIYTVINPNIVDGVYNVNNQLFEYGENGLVNDSYVEKWIMDHMFAVSRFIHANNLFELLTYDIKRLDNYDNYLFVIKPITLDDLIKSTKKFGILLGALIVLGTIAYIIL